MGVINPDPLLRDVYCILGLPIDVIEMPAVFRQIDVAIANATPFLISTANVNFLVLSQFDRNFAESLLLSDVCTADGMPIVWIARLLGIPLKHRVAGSDMFEALKSEQRLSRPLKLFLFGGADGAAATAASALNETPDRVVQCVGWISPGFGTIDEMSTDDIIEKINASAADFLVVSLGARKGHLWLQRNHHQIRIPVRTHLGAVMNFEAGAVRRAPQSLRKYGLSGCGGSRRNLTCGAATGVMAESSSNCCPRGSCRSLLWHYTNGCGSQPKPWKYGTDWTANLQPWRSRVLPLNRVCPRL